MEPRLQRNLIGICLVAAPLLMLASDGNGLVPWDPSGWIASMAFWCSFLAYVGVAVGCVRLAGNTGLATVGGALAIAGSLIGITIIGMSRVQWSMEEHGVAAETVREVMGEPILFLTSRAPGLMFPIGLILLALALRAARVLDTGSTVLLILGIALFPVGRISTAVAFNVVGDALMLLVLGRLGVNVLRRRVG